MFLFAGGIFFLIFIVPIFFTLHSPNAGEHTGYVTAIEESGLIWKTSTVYIKTDPQSSQEDAYCVVDSNVINQLKEKSTTRELVTIQYSVPFLVPGWKCKGEGSIVDSVNAANVGTSTQS